MPKSALISTPQGDQQQGGPPLDRALRAAHDAWVHEARSFLQPVMEPAADFWTRWAAVRYLDDEFRDRYDLERARLVQLRPFLARGTTERLARGGDRVFQLRLELDRAGRRRGTAAEVAERARALHDQLMLWLAEVEQATAGRKR